jgi:diguanylate cyclase (GGDEF)-like protein
VRNCRETDLVARLGGDEFLAVFAETDQAKAKNVIERLQTGIRELMEHHHWPIAFSGGCITYQTPPPNVDHILAEADKLMYSAKHQGKNRVEYEEYGVTQDT